MDLNEVRVADDADFLRLKQLCENHDGWDLVYSKKHLHVWTKVTPQTDFKIIKARSEFHDVPAATIYDVLHDSEYRKQWDKFMLEGTDIGILNPNNDICYYCIKSPPPFRNRDFVMQRSWLETPSEMMIFNHSVCHEDYPPRKGCVRAISFLTGYLVRAIGSHSSQITYVTQSDPKGFLPIWVVNRLTSVVCPKMMKKLHSACLQYPTWKSKNQPNKKPWINPDQLNLPRIDLSKCKPKDYGQEIFDESKVAPLEVDKEIAEDLES